MDKNINILAINTSSTSGSIALYTRGAIVHLSYLDIKKTHSERLMPQINLALEQNNLSAKELDLICIANGPGSFTGIRIGLATAKGFSFANKIPILPIDNLKLLATNLWGSKRAILTFIDAKMSEVYAALYDENLNEIIPPQNSKPDEFLQKIDQPVIIVGDGAEKYEEIIKQSNIDFIVAQPHQHLDLASTMISIALQKDEIPKYSFDEIANLEPYYLRKSQAEIEREKKLQN